MKFRSPLRPFVPILALLIVAVAACAQDGGGQSSTPSPLPAIAPTEAPRPLTASERAAISEFETQLQSIDGERQEFYGEFDSWRAGLAECHPSSALEALRDFAASFATVSDAAGNLPRTSITGGLADMVVAATDAEGAALRQLRDRWQPGNITLFEAVEQRKAESGAAHNAVADMSLSLMEELRAGPTLDEVDEMEAFSDTFDAIADSWDDFHDNYSAFARRESRLDAEEVAAGYRVLAEELSQILDTVEQLTASEINEDIIERLEDAAEHELAILEFRAEFPPEPGESSPEAVPGIRPPATPSAPEPPETASTPAPPETGEPGQEESPQSDQSEQLAPAAAADSAVPVNGVIDDAEMAAFPSDELAAAVMATEAILEELEQSIEDFIDDDSAQQLEELQAFEEDLARLVSVWDRFHEEFTDWRLTEGGCDRVEVTADLARFSQQAGELAAAVRELPQPGPLVSVYNLAAESAEREAGAFRTLAYSWTPFAVDVFKAVDDERVSARRLRRQASIALGELQNR